MRADVGCMGVVVGVGDIGISTPVRRIPNVILLLSTEPGYENDAASAS
jgi:hypothetical protein